jgi:hypothetical protein
MSPEQIWKEDHLKYLIKGVFFLFSEAYRTLTNFHSVAATSCLTSNKSKEWWLEGKSLQHRISNLRRGFRRLRFNQVLLRTLERCLVGTLASRTLQSRNLSRGI